MKNKTLWIVIILLISGCLVLFCLAALALLAFASLTFSSPSSGRLPAEGSQAPDFELPTLAGETIRLSQLRGQPVLLTFSATWCSACKEEAATLQELHETYPNLKVLVVDSKEDQGTIQAFADENGLTYSITVDEFDDVNRQYHIYAIPTLFFLDSQGVIRARFIGTITDDTLHQALSSIGVSP